MVQIFGSIKSLGAPLYTSIRSFAFGDYDMVIREPRYWGSWKGRVVSAIVTNGEQTWTELLEKTGLNVTSLNKVLAELFQAKAIEKKGEGTQAKYRVARDLYDQYRVFLKSSTSIDAVRVEKPLPSTKFVQARRDKLVEWVEQWKRLKKLEFSLDPKHFFLEGMYLDDLSKSLIRAATLEVLAVNPYVEHCDLSNVLRDAAKNAQVVLVTHPPEDNNQFPRDRQEYHKTLTQEGVKMIYNKRIHAKLIVVDRAVAIVSSMNLYGSSSGGVSWEAGLVSIEDTVVECVADSILTLIERPESKEMEPRGKA